MRIAIYLRSRPSTQSTSWVVSMCHRDGRMDKTLMARYGHESERWFSALQVFELGV